LIADGAANRMAANPNQQHNQSNIASTMWHTFITELAEQLSLGR